MSHSMMASSPNITGKTQLETLCSYCGHNMPVTLDLSLAYPTLLVSTTQQICHL
jgi:hypothetical protein